MDHSKAFASASLLAIAAVTVATVACSGGPDGVVLDREDDPPVSATTTVATATATARAVSTASPAGLTCFDYDCSGAAGTEECRQLCHESDALCVVSENEVAGHCSLP
jgi:hypothetical protein